MAQLPASQVTPGFVSSAIACACADTGSLIHEPTVSDMRRTKSGPAGVSWSLDSKVSMARPVPARHKANSLSARNRAAPAVS